jgi:hypothetical protein
MSILVDTHIHLYPCYSLPQALTSCITNLHALAPDAVAVACLTERHDCFFFQKLREGSLVVDGFDVERNDDPNSLHLTTVSGQMLVLAAGRQIITKERLEVLALTADLRIPDGLPIRETIKQVIAEGAAPVLPWSPGKWFFNRGEIINAILHESDPQSVLVGDVTLRPRGWPTPHLIRTAQQLGFKTLYGSDPLPFPGEEQMLGRYATYYSNSSLDASLQSPALRHLLLTTKGAACGHRSSLQALALRLKRNSDTRKQTT